MSKKKFSTFGNVFDESTLRILFKLSSQGYFDEMLSPVLIGKEANVFTASKGKGKVIVKIYRTQACDFNKMYDYLAPDPRFPKIKKNKREIISTWARKEYRNLLIARKVGINVPTPYAVNGNVLVMEMIGRDEPAKRVKEQLPENIEQFYESFIKDVRKLYKEAKLIHADLSEYNVLIMDDKPYIIDLSHAISMKYPRFVDFLERDLKIMVKFFNRKGLKLEYEKVLKYVTNGTENK